MSITISKGQFYVSQGGKNPLAYDVYNAVVSRPVGKVIFSVSEPSARFVYDYKIGIRDEMKLTCPTNMIDEVKFIEQHLEFFSKNCNKDSLFMADVDFRIKNMAGGGGSNGASVSGGSGGSNGAVPYYKNPYYTKRNDTWRDRMIIDELDGFAPDDKVETGRKAVQDIVAHTTRKVLRDMMKIIKEQDLGKVGVPCVTSSDLRKYCKEHNVDINDII